MSDLAVRVAKDADDFAVVWKAVTRVIDPTVRLPQLPFVPRGGTVAVGQFTRLLGVDFVPVFQALARAHDDDDIAAAVVEPAKPYYEQHYGFLPAFSVGAQGLDNGYWKGLTYSPSGDPTGEIGVSADVFAVVGSSGRWAVWGERFWDVALLWTMTSGPWLNVGVPFVTPRAAVEDFAGYGTWGTRLNDDAVREFVRNVEALG